MRSVEEWNVRRRARRTALSVRKTTPRVRRTMHVLKTVHRRTGVSGIADRRTTGQNLAVKPTVRIRLVAITDAKTARATRRTITIRVTTVTSRTDLLHSFD